MFTDIQFLCQNRPVTLGLGQQEQEIRVVQNVLHLGTGEKTFDVLGQRRGDASFLSEHPPYGHKVAGGQSIFQQNVELIKIAPCSNTVCEIGVDRSGDKLIGNVHGDLSQIFSHAFEYETHHAGIEVDIGLMVKEI